MTTTDIKVEDKLELMHQRKYGNLIADIGHALSLVKVQYARLVTMLKRTKENAKPGTRMSAVRISSTKVRLWNVTEKILILWIEDENQRHVFSVYYYYYYYYYVPRITDFCIRVYLFECRLSLCGSDFGIAPLDDITNGIT
jgi:hypothetical protein